MYIYNIYTYIYTYIDIYIYIYILALSLNLILCTESVGGNLCVTARERETQKESVCAYVCVRVCAVPHHLSLHKLAHPSKKVCSCVSVRVRARERKREKAKETEMGDACVRVLFCLSET